MRERARVLLASVACDLYVLQRFITLRPLFRLDCLDEKGTTLIIAAARHDAVGRTVFHKVFYSREDAHGS